MAVLKKSTKRTLRKVFQPLDSTEETGRVSRRLAQSDTYLRNLQLPHSHSHGVNSSDPIDGADINIDADDVDVEILAGATYDDVQDFINFFGDRTLLSGGAISDNGDGDATVAAGTAWCKATDSDTAVGLFFDFSADTSVTLTDLTTNFLYVDYNAGTPQIVIATSILTYGFKQDHVFVGTAYREGTNLHIHQSSNMGIQSANRTHMHWLEHFLVHRVSGIVTSSTGTRNLSVTAGVVYAGLNRNATLAFDTSRSGTADADAANKLHDADSDFTAGDVGKEVHNTTDDIYGLVTAYVDSGELTLLGDTFPDGNEAYNLDWFSYWYYDGDLGGGAAWVEVPGQVQIDNTQYNAVATGLATLTAGRTGVHWVYMDNDGKHLHIVYDIGDYTTNQAEEAGVPASLPNIVSNYCVLIAKIKVVKSSDTLTILYPWTTTFTSTGATDHGSLGGLGDDDHTQYLLIDGTREMSGNLIIPDDGTIGSSTTNDAVQIIADGGLVLGKNTAKGLEISGTASSAQLYIGGTAILASGEQAIYINCPSETVATNGIWIALKSTVTSGDLSGIRSRAYGNAASAGANVRGGYLEAKMAAASKYAAMLEGALLHADYSAGSITISGDVRGFTAHISQGSGLNAANLYGGLINIQTRGDETIATDDIGLKIRNEAVGGNGRQMDAAILIAEATMGGGTKGFGYGIDLSGATYGSADVRLSSGAILKDSGLWDTDGDTGIQVEESADEDIIRMDVGGSEAFQINAVGVHTYALSSRCRVFRDTTNQSIPDATATKIQFNAETYDQQNEFDSASTFRFTADYDGQYLITMQIGFQGLEDGDTISPKIRMNGDTIVQNFSYLGATGVYGGTITTTSDLAASDYIEGWVRQDSGGAEDLNKGSNATSMSILKLH